MLHKASFSVLITQAPSENLHGTRADNPKFTQKWSFLCEKNIFCWIGMCVVFPFWQLWWSMIITIRFCWEEWVRKEKLLNWFVLLPAKHAVGLCNISQEIRHQEERWWTIFYLISQLCSWLAEQEAKDVLHFFPVVNIVSFLKLHCRGDAQLGRKCLLAVGNWNSSSQPGWNFILVIRRWKAMCYLWAVILLLWNSGSALPAVQGWEYATSWPSAQIVNLPFNILLSVSSQSFCL